MVGPACILLKTTVHYYIFVQRIYSAAVGLLDRGLCHHLLHVSLHHRHYSQPYLLHVGLDHCVHCHYRLLSAVLTVSLGLGQDLVFDHGVIIQHPPHTSHGDGSLE